MHIYKFYLVLTKAICTVELMIVLNFFVFQFQYNFWNWSYEYFSTPFPFFISKSWYISYKDAKYCRRFRWSLISYFHLINVRSYWWLRNILCAFYQQSTINSASIVYLNLDSFKLCWSSLYFCLVLRGSIVN